MTAPQDNSFSEHANAPAPPSLLQIFWTRKSLIILGAVVGLLGGIVYFVQRKPVFESSAQVLVDRKMPELSLPGYEGYGFFDDYLATQINIISSRSVVLNAVEYGELSNLKSFQSFQRLGDKEKDKAVTEVIRGALKVNREAQQNGYGGASTLSLVYHGSDPDDCPVVLSAVIASYQKFLFDRYFKKSKDTTDALLATVNKLMPELGKLREDQKQLLSEGPVMIGRDGITVEEEELAAIQARRSALAIRRKELEAKLAAIALAIKERRDPSIVLEAGDPTKSLTFLGPNSIGTTPLSDASIAVQLMPQIIELQKLEERFGKGYPEARVLRSHIGKAAEILRGNSTLLKTGPTMASTSPLERTLFDSGAGSIGLLASPGNQGPLVAATMLFTNQTTTREVTRYVQILKAQLEEAQLTEKLLKDLAEWEVKEVQGMADFRYKKTSLEKEIASKERDLETLNNLSKKNALGGVGGFEATVIAEPGRGYQIEPKAGPILTMGLLLGLASGFALAWLAEATDKSFRTPEEVRRRLGLAVVGHVPRIKATEEAQRQYEAGALPLEPTICAFYQSKSIEAESFRGIRTTLYFNAQTEGCKLIQITSPNMGDGKTTLATNLAVSIAQSGKKILLIDADFRRPRLHRMFGLEARVGLATVIQEQAELLDALQPTPVPNLSLLPCGVRPSNPAELLTSPRFKEVLETLRERYDIILIDTPPLLAVSDPSVVASQVDGVLLTIRVSKNGRPAAERARDILTTLDANILGVIVNGIGNRSKEGYGASHYNYQYQYQYAYEPSDNHSYYQDGEPDSQIHRNGDGAHHGLNGDAGDPDAVDLGSAPVKSEPPRQRIPGTRRRRAKKTGLVAGMANWLRSTLWH